MGNCQIFDQGFEVVRTGRVVENLATCIIINEANLFHIRKIIIFASKWYEYDFA